MKPTSIILLILFLVLPEAINAQLKSPLTGLKEEVEVIRDHWGINHIYAQNDYDLFYTQGYLAAKDRTFQFEVWRRQASGTSAEILGRKELERDIGTRLFKFRGDIEQEMNHYHPKGSLIINAYVDGVNQLVKEMRASPDELPMEFKLLDILPEFWTPEIVISRHQGLLGNIKQELNTGRAVVKIGSEKLKDLSYFHPNDPDLTIDPSIDQASLFEDILAPYEAYRKPLSFDKSDLGENEDEKYNELAGTDPSLGSNNWVLSGELSQNGFPMMANDPHRTLAVPSLRYWAHLVAPGWNVIGGGEPEIPGISIGHNEYGAWGLTVFRTDAEDLYFYKTNPNNPNQYWFRGQWENMTIIKEKISIKGEKKPVEVELKYTRHGPITYEDESKNIAYGMRCGWMEVGGAPYLASLRMNQAKTWEEFREACYYSNIPGENMIWADREGNIGWQAVGISPIRPNHSGMVPVPGDGRFEWSGYLPISEKPNDFNPAKGYIATANQNVTPVGYKHKNSLAYNWSDPFRGSRLDEIFGSGQKHTLATLQSVQTDYISLPARSITAMFKTLRSSDSKTEAARKKLLAWNHEIAAESIEASIYVTMERLILEEMKDMMVPDEAKDYMTISLKKTLDWLTVPRAEFGPDPIKGRNEFLLNSLKEAIGSLEQRFGRDQSKWIYGQTRFKHSYLEHALSKSVGQTTRDKLDVGPLPRGGNGTTVGSTGGNNRQRSGATFRIIVDTEDWDNCIGANSPGQSGDPDSKYYDNLFELWATDQFFPVPFTKSKIRSMADEVKILSPRR